MPGTPWPKGAPSLDEFTAHVTEQGHQHYRDLPWRSIDDPYGVLVSEVMLQQTQVPRVLPRWQHFMGVFPSIDALAAADTADVLEEWQGLGYNRRALLLKAAAKECSLKYAGSLPQTAEELRELPGIGPATAAGVMAFAYDQPCVYVETNVRTVFLHELFPKVEGVSDKQIIPLVQAACPSSGVREWYYALLDYGAYLKSTFVNPSRRSAHYAKQTPFEGSRRQKRAELLRVVLAAESISHEEAAATLDAFEQTRGRAPLDPALFASIARDLAAEGFFHDDGRFFFVRTRTVL